MESDFDVRFLPLKEIHQRHDYWFADTDQLVPTYLFRYPSSV